MAKTRRTGRPGNKAPGRVRIVAGKWRGRFLPVEDAPELRPTAERVRETLFNWLAPAIEGARCLDLFAGTGVLGFEALSRGAGAVTFVERSKLVAAGLEHSMSMLGARDASLHVADAFSWLRTSRSQPFDVVFLDPPYALDSLTDLCRLLQAGRWLAEGASIFMEQDLRRVRPVLPEGYRLSREKTAGNVRYSLARSSIGREAATEG